MKTFDNITFLGLKERKILVFGLNLQLIQKALQIIQQMLQQLGLIAWYFKMSGETITIPVHVVYVWNDDGKIQAEYEFMIN